MDDTICFDRIGSECHCAKKCGWSDYNTDACSECKIRFSQSAEEACMQEKLKEEEKYKRTKIIRGTIRTAVQLALRNNLVLHAGEQKQEHDLQTLSKELCSKRITLGEEGQGLLLRLVRFLDSAPFQAAMRVHLAWTRLKSSETALHAAQSEVSSAAAECEKATDIPAASSFGGESLAGIVQRRDEVRQMLMKDSEVFLVTRLDSESELPVCRQSLDELIGHIRRYLASTTSDGTTNGQISEISPSLSSEELRKKLQAASSAVSDWVRSINTKLITAWEARVKTAYVYAVGLRQLASILDGSGHKLDSTDGRSLEDSLLEAYMSLEGAFTSEEEILVDESLVQSFPFDTIISAIRDSLGWLQEMSFKLNEFRTVDEVQAALDMMQNLKDPKPLITQRGELKQKIQELGSDLMDKLHTLAKHRMKNLHKDDIEEQIQMAKSTIRNRTNELEQTDNKLWLLVGHYPEYRSMMKQELKQLVGSVEDEAMGLFTSYDSLDLYEVERQLSVLGQQGARHNVRLVKRGEQRLVIKEFDLTGDQRERKRFMKEVSILHRLEHPFLVKLCGAFLESKVDLGTTNMTVQGYLKMPYQEGGTLWSWMQATKPRKQQKQRVLMQILQGLEHLRQNRVIHCDIKPANILMSSLSADAEPRIADFDVSKEQKDRATDLIATITTSYCVAGTYVAGTWAYMAPELIDPSSAGDRRASHKSDMFSFGVTMAEFLQEKQREGFSVDALDALVVGLEAQTMDLIVKMLVRDPVKRLSSGQALMHPYFTHSMISEREELDHQRIKMRAEQERKMAELVSQQKELEQQEQTVFEKIESLRSEEKQLLAQHRELLLKGKLKQEEAKTKEERLQEQKQALTEQRMAVKIKQQNLQARVQSLSEEGIRLEHEWQKTETERLLFAHDRVVLNLPLYWRQNSQASLRTVHIDVTSEWKADIQNLLDGTCKREHIGKGKATLGLKHEGFKVEKVFRIENMERWSAYALHRKSTGFRALNHGRPNPISEVSTGREWMKSRLQQDETSNEVFLFHGTKPDLVRTIMEAGFDQRVSDPSCLFGVGIYLAENSSKGDEYCTPNAEGFCYMFLARTVLGTPYETLVPMKDIMRPPCLPGGERRLYDSVIGVTTATHRKAFLQTHRIFAVYDRNQVYPELLIKYRRV
eukprot:768604-Hanusia_phi.AAC.1